MLMISALTAHPCAVTSPAPTAGEIALGLLRDGFVEGPPVHLQSWAKSVDAEVCEEQVCDGCGRVGMVYRPFCKSVGSGVQYRAVCQCAVCPHGFEL